MGALEEIISNSTDSSVSTSDLLRKVRVIAKRTQSQELDEWVKKELQGYLEEDILPVYRAPLRVQVLGTFKIGYTVYNNMVVPMMGVPYNMEKIFHAHFFESSSTLEQQVSDNKSLESPWPQEAISIYNGLIAKGLITTINPFSQLLWARRLVPLSPVANVLDNIRTSVLDFALDLEATNSTIGEVGGPTIQQKEVDTTINYFIENKIYGGSATLVQGNIQVNPGDIVALLSTINSLSSPELSQEVQAVTALPPEEQKSAISRILAGVKDGAINVGSSVVTNTAQQAMSQFLGLS